MLKAHLVKFLMHLYSMSKNILITGAAGFIGSHLCKHFLKLGYKVRAVDNFSTGKKNNIKSILNNTNFEFFEGDIRDINLCMTLCKNIDFISHQAALGSVPRSIKDPITSNDVNVTGFLNIIKSASKNDIKRFVFASSSSVYGDSIELPKIEENIGDPLSPYALTKSINEMYAKVFKSVFELDYIGLRYFNVFGPNQDPKGPYAAVIPKFIEKFINYENPIINGDGTFSRDFTYIENVVLMNQLAIESIDSNALNQVYNVAYGSRVSILEMTNEIKKLLSKYDTNINNIKILHRENRDGDVPHSLASIEKANNLLNYYPKVDFESGLSKTVNWFWKNKINF